MRKKQIAVVLTACMFLVILSVMAFTKSPADPAAEPLISTFLKVGKADAIVLESGGQAMVIDTGEEDDGQELVDFLKGRNISGVDVLIITHYDKDHVGGADTLIEQIPVDRVLIPDYTGSSTEYSDFLDAMEKASIEPERVSSQLSFTFVDAAVTVDPPASFKIRNRAMEYDNNFSLITTVIHGDNRLVYTGDIEKARIREIMSDGGPEKCSFLKVPHHGVYNTALEEYIKRLSPEYAVICSSNKNPAEKKTLELLKKYGTTALETRHGNIFLISDGKHLELRQKVKL